MRLYFYGCLMLIQKFFLRRSTGRVICDFAKRMGVVYIKVAQILAMQNIGSIFTEQDRMELAAICDHCNPLPFSKIRQKLEQEYQRSLDEIFQSIDEQPLGSASISQVHRAVLKSGEVVAVKVKRADVTRRIEHDVKQIRRLIHRFGRFARFRNFLGSDKALKYYVDWIYQETDFIKERQNLARYAEFATSVNGRIKNTANIVAPKVYPDFCTNNIIVMEFIAHPTVNQLELSADNKQKITRAVNDYLRLSFYALFHNLPVVFHGDPHGGNIYLDQAGNLGFLDMGLIFEFDADEADFIRKLFLYSYTKKSAELVDLLINRSDYTNFDREQLVKDISAEVERLQTIPVTQYFVEMIGVFTKYDIAPPILLFKMAKAFLALFGINNFVENFTDTKELLTAQVFEFYLHRTAEDVQGIFKSGLALVPNFLRTTLQNGPAAGFSNQILALSNLSRQAQTTLANCREVLDFML